MIAQAFAGHPHSDGTEAQIYRRLAGAGDIALSLVAVAEPGRVVGHIVFSEVSIDGRRCGWCGLGPLAVLPRWQGGGVGSALVRHGLAALRADGWAGCVVLGDPAFYGRFGFRAEPSLSYPSVPREYFQGLAFEGAVPAGEVSYAPAFG